MFFKFLCKAITTQQCKINGGLIESCTLNLKQYTKVLYKLNIYLLKQVHQKLTVKSDKLYRSIDHHNVSPFTIPPVSWNLSSLFSCSILVEFRHDNTANLILLSSGIVLGLLPYTFCNSALSNPKENRPMLITETRADMARKPCL